MNNKISDKTIVGIMYILFIIILICASFITIYFYNIKYSNLNANTNLNIKTIEEANQWVFKNIKYQKDYERCCKKTNDFSRWMNCNE